MASLFWLIKNCISALSEKMGDLGLGTVTRHLSFKGSSKGVHNDMEATLGECAPLYSVVKKCDAEYKDDREMTATLITQKRKTTEAKPPDRVD